jgi:hypothetical protein
MRFFGGCVITAAAIAFGTSASACVAHEETTPHGYVIAPSVPADAGFVIDAASGDAAR